jgi:hypothetical protein
VGKIAGLLEALRGETFEGMRPADRRYIAATFRLIADQADPDKPPPAKAGILADLKRGARAD